MKISNQEFPFYQEAKAQFGASFEKGFSFTYGNVIHTRVPVSPDLLVHEQVHSVQQERMGKDLWWRTYLTNPKFRLAQEIPAYKAQYRFLKGTDRERNHYYAYQLAGFLAQPEYGNLISRKEALKLITA